VRGFLAALYKEFIHIRRDPATLVLTLAIPLLQITLFGYAINTDVKNIPTVVYDMDQRRAGRELIAAYRNTDYFRIVAEVHSDRELNDAIVAGRAKVGIKVPSDFSQRLFDDRQATVLVLVDGSDSSIAMNALNVANAVGLRTSLTRLGATAAAGQPAMPVEVRPKMLFNPDLKSANFIIPGLIGIIMQNITILLTAFAIVRERERGTLEQLMVTPIRPLGLMLGKLIPYGVIGFIETCMVLLLMRGVFGVPIHGSLVLLLAFSFLFLLPSLGIGLFISTVATNQSQAYQMAFFIIMPSILLSGFMFPRDSMPTVMYYGGYLLPVTYFLEILRGVILRGAGLAHLWVNAVVLVAFGAVILVVSALRFRKRIA
jgi:ABC transporter DrrB family efflux protein